MENPQQTHWKVSPPHGALFKRLTDSLSWLTELEVRFAAGAIYSSVEHCDAPKCQPETWVAVQDDLYSWIIDGDGKSEDPKKIKWVTGPAGTGKTAVMGSLSKQCKLGGIVGQIILWDKIMLEQILKGKLL
jgi:hypothetical protein